jgi:hypothetical protein
MMGQQQQTVAEKAGGTLRRALVLMTVVALMVAILAVSAAPAFAGGKNGAEAIKIACTNSKGKAFSGGPGSGSC